MVYIHVQVSISVTFCIKSYSQTDNNSRYYIGYQVVELHGTLVYVTYLIQHTVHM